MIRFMIGADPEDLSDDPVFDRPEVDITHAKQKFFDILINVIDEEDMLPGRYLKDTESGRVWRIVFSLDAEEVTE